MLFNSEVFIVFCAIFFPIYFLCRSGYQQNSVTFVASLVFYGWWSWKFVFLILASITFNYLIGLRIRDAVSQALRKSLLFLAIFANLLILGVFKYANFFISSVIAAFATIGVDLPESHLNIILPVGISFFTFQAMSYIIDIYQKRIPAEPDYVKFGTYIALFPQLVAGPIVRSSFLLPQLEPRRRFRWANFWLGLEMFIIGAVLKIIVANRLAPVVDQFYGQYDQQNPLALLIATLFFAFQIYGDFAGYSLMAIGVGRVMGLSFPANFRRPYMAVGFSDFWRRWHISLSSWLRDYLYIPLGGNRGGTWGRSRNLMITMLLGGLWHGASWAFVFWGFLHGLYQVVQASVGEPFKNAMTALRYPGKLISRLFVFVTVCIAWIYFRVTDFGEATAILVAMGDVAAYSWAEVPNKVDVTIGLGIIAALVVVELVCEDTPWLKIYRETRWLRLGGGLILIQLLVLLGIFSGDAFIYFQF